MTDGDDPGFVIRAVADSERDAVRDVMTDAWASPVVVVHDDTIDVMELPMLVAIDRSGQLVGVLSYRELVDSYEVVTLNALTARAGIGTALLLAVFERARAAARERVWLITTNDNLDALRFYQRRGMRLVNVDVGAVDRARILKPSIPLTADNGIAIRDELELELRLA